MTKAKTEHPANARRTASLQPIKGRRPSRRNASVISRVVAHPISQLPFTIASRLRDHIIPTSPGRDVNELTRARGAYPPLDRERTHRASPQLRSCVNFVVFRHARMSTAIKAGSNYTSLRACLVSKPHKHLAQCSGRGYALGKPEP